MSDSAEWKCRRATNLLDYQRPPSRPFATKRGRGFRIARSMVLCGALKKARFGHLRDFLTPLRQLRVQRRLLVEELPVAEDALSARATARNHSSSCSSVMDAWIGPQCTRAADLWCRSNRESVRPKKSYRSDSAQEPNA